MNCQSVKNQIVSWLKNKDYKEQGELHPDYPESEDEWKMKMKKQKIKVINTNNENIVNEVLKKPYYKNQKKLKELFYEVDRDYDNLVANGTITGSWEVERGVCDVVDAANKIFYLYEHPVLREQMGKNGRKCVEDEYDFETVVAPA